MTNVKVSWGKGAGFITWLNITASKNSLMPHKCSLLSLPRIIWGKNLLLILHFDGEVLHPSLVLFPVYSFFTHYFFTSPVFWVTSHLCPVHFQRTFFEILLPGTYIFIAQSNWGSMDTCTPDMGYHPLNSEQRASWPCSLKAIHILHRFHCGTGNFSGWRL